MDVVSRKERSWIMSRVLQKHTKQEIIVRKLLFGMGYRYRINYRALPGSPDIVLPKYQVAIFVHGCFWHNHKRCRLGRRPTSNRLFWDKKLDDNVKRDQAKIKELRKLGWRVIVIWQCDLENRSKSERRLNKLLTEIQL